MIIQDKELYKELDIAGNLMKEIRSISKEIDGIDEKKAKLEKERNRLAILHQKAKFKIFPLMEKYTDKLGEYEDVQEVAIKEENGRKTKFIEITIADRHEEWKKEWAKAKTEFKAEFEKARAASEAEDKATEQAKEKAKEVSEKK